MPTRSTLLFLNQLTREYNSKLLDIQKQIVIKQAVKKAIISDFYLDLITYITGSNKVAKIDLNKAYKILKEYCKQNN